MGSRAKTWKTSAMYGTWRMLLAISAIIYCAFMAKLYINQEENNPREKQTEATETEVDIRSRLSNISVTNTAVDTLNYVPLNHTSPDVDRENITNDSLKESQGLWNTHSSAVTHCTLEPNIDCTMPRTYIIYVYSARNRTDRRQLIRNTWGRLNEYRNLSVNVQLFFVLGVSSDNSSYLDAGLEMEANRSKDILMCDFVDTYNNLTLKGLAALKWINSTCDGNNLEFVFKTDDDVYVSLWKVFLLANRATEADSHFVGACSGKHRVRRFGKWAISKEEYSEDKYPEYCSGGGYGMTRKGFLLLMDSVDKVPIFPIEDTFFTSLAIRWAHPQVNISYHSTSLRAANMQLNEPIIHGLMNNTRRLNRFILGHPVPADLWIKLHQTLKNV